MTLFSDQDVEEKGEASMVRLPASLWKRLADIAANENQRVRSVKPDAKKVSRNDVIKKVLGDFADAYEAEVSGPKKPVSKRGA